MEKTLISYIEMSSGQVLQYLIFRFSSLGGKNWKAE